MHTCDQNRRLLPAPNANVEAANDVLLFFCEGTMLNVWPQIVEPSQPAAFPASLQPWNKSFIHSIKSYKLRSSQFIQKASKMKEEKSLT